MRIAVFTGSSRGPQSHRTAAAELGRGLAEAGVGIVYGGATVGLMGTVADASLAAGGEVVGVIPQHLVDREIAHPGLTDLRVVETMHERKALMVELADGFVALPGGAGTLDEVFEAFTWGQLGLHAKPVALYDVDGFYRHLVGHLDTMAAEGYLSRAHREVFASVTTPAELLGLVEGYRHPERKAVGPRP